MVRVPSHTPTSPPGCQPGPRQALRDICIATQLIDDPGQGRPRGDGNHILHRGPGFGLVPHHRCSVLAPRRNCLTGRSVPGIRTINSLSGPPVCTGCLFSFGAFYAFVWPGGVFRLWRFFVCVHGGGRSLVWPSLSDLGALFVG